jgi:hypothetical protein
LFNAQQSRLVQRAVEGSEGDIAALSLDATHAAQMFPPPGRATTSPEKNGYGGQAVGGDTGLSQHHWSLSSAHEDELQRRLRVVRGLLCDNTTCCKHKFDLRKTLISDDQRCMLTDDDHSLNVFMNHVLFHLDKSVAQAIERAHATIRLRHQAMLGDVMHTDMWKRYGLMDASAGKLS